LALRYQEDLALAYKWLEDNPVYWQRRAKALHPGRTKLFWKQRQKFEE
jgi:hypothetical protein